MLFEDFDPVTFSIILPPPYYAFFPFFTPVDHPQSLLVQVGVRLFPPFLPEPRPTRSLLLCSLSFFFCLRERPSFLLIFLMDPPLQGYSRPRTLRVATLSTVFFLRSKDKIPLALMPPLCFVLLHHLAGRSPSPSPFAGPLSLVVGLGGWVGVVVCNSFFLYSWRVHCVQRPACASCRRGYWSMSFPPLYLSGVSHLLLLFDRISEPSPPFSSVSGFAAINKSPFLPAPPSSRIYHMPPFFSPSLRSLPTHSS